MPCILWHTILSLPMLTTTWRVCVVRGCVCVYSYVCASLSELIQTELHHMRTLHIMERVFRQGMLEELQLDLCTVYAMFPCLDQLTRIHSHFLSQLLLRRNSSLQSGSSRNFTIHQLGDILLEQVYTIPKKIIKEGKAHNSGLKQPCLKLTNTRRIASNKSPTVQIKLIYSIYISLLLH